MNKAVDHIVMHSRQNFRKPMSTEQAVVLAQALVLELDWDAGLEKVMAMEMG